MNFIYLIILSLTFTASVKAQSNDKLEMYLGNDISWFKSSEAQRIIDNLILYQHNNGGWIKNLDMTIPLSENQKEIITAQKDSGETTIDNGATYTQLRFIAKVHSAAPKEKYLAPFYKGINYLLKAQYKNGGWPQFYPLVEGYYTHITFNDDAMINVMRLLNDISKGKNEFGFVKDEIKTKCREAVNRGIECILKCQIKVNDTLTAWCAQHNEFNFSPANARTYEVASISGCESVGIIEFLMSIKNPSHEIINAIQSAVSYLNKVKIKGIRVIEVPEKESPSGRNKIVVKDSTAEPIWARFYEIGTNRGMFLSRDGIVHYDLSEISTERRNHYNWLSYWPKELLTKKYPLWAAKHKLKSVVNY